MRKMMLKFTSWKQTYKTKNARYLLEPAFMHCPQIFFNIYKTFNLLMINVTVLDQKWQKQMKNFLFFFFSDKRMDSYSFQSKCIRSSLLLLHKMTVWCLLDNSNASFTSHSWNQNQFQTVLVMHCRNMTKITYWKLFLKTEHGCLNCIYQFLDHSPRLSETDGFRLSVRVPIQDTTDIFQILVLELPTQLTILIFCSSEVNFSKTIPSNSE